MKKNITQEKLIEEFFKAHPNRDIPHPEAVDWLTQEYKKRTGKEFRDPDRGIRKLGQQGFLKKVGKGIYRYEPNAQKKRKSEDFSEKQKKEIFERDKHRCVVCGKRKEDGDELQIDHIIPKDKGGEATRDNGQVLCAPCNYRKKTYGQTETEKKMFIRLYEQARNADDKKVMEFCEDIFKTFERHEVNGHIEWKK